MTNEQINADEKLLKLVRKVQLKTGNPITIKSLARRMGLGQQATLQLCEDNGLNINIGFALDGGGGIAEFNYIGEYSVEDLNAPYLGDL